MIAQRRVAEQTHRRWRKARSEQGSRNAKI
jgi:hypothetical protein